MVQYIGVRFREQGQIYYFKASPFIVTPGCQVVVSTEEGLGIARVDLVCNLLPPELEEDKIKPIERVANQKDEETEAENTAIAKQAFAYCQEQIEKIGLEMKLVDVEVRFDQSKMVFYFTAPTRIDFRELVKVLVNKYHTRIELRQIGVRHEAQILGGIGNCGRICCCHLFLRKFEPVTIKMAKQQHLFLNPSKISGTCGRLLCCLNFEKESYAEFQKRCPKIGRKYETSLGELKVLRANLFRDSLIVETPSGEEREVTLLEWPDLVAGRDDMSLFNNEHPGEEAEDEEENLEEQLIFHEDTYDLNTLVENKLENTQQVVSSQEALNQQANQKKFQNKKNGNQNNEQEKKKNNGQKANNPGRKKRKNQAKKLKSKSGAKKNRSGNRRRQKN